jgi:UDP-glucuronate 4-epimerase
MNIFITGIAGMIGYHLARKLHAMGYNVSGIDDMNVEYDDWLALPNPFNHGTLKRHRRQILEAKGIMVYEDDFVKAPRLWQSGYNCPDLVIHLAAYANPRHSIARPIHYTEDNATKTNQLIRLLEKTEIQKVIYASTSCVMHGQPLPWKESDRPGHQICPYGWSKWANECDFGVSKIETAIGMRFFTVYGPLGRPDMALFKFARLIDEKKPVELYTDEKGEFLKRDFTYVDDVVQAVALMVLNVTTGTVRGKDIYNVGQGRPMDVYEFVSEIGRNLRRPVETIQTPKPSCDVDATWADTTKLQALGWSPSTTTEEGVREFIDWYKVFYDR